MVAREAERAVSRENAHLQICHVGSHATLYSAVSALHWHSTFSRDYFYIYMFIITVRMFLRSLTVQLDKERVLAMKSAGDGELERAPPARLMTAC